MSSVIETAPVPGQVSYPACLLDRLYSNWGIGQKNAWLLTLGGQADELALTWAAKGVRVTALDPAEEALNRIEALAQKARVQLTCHQSPAEATGLQPSRFDTLVALQSWPLFDQQKAGQEARRLLVDRGSLVLAHLTPLSRAGNLVEATHRLMEMHVSFWLRSAGEGFYPEWIETLQETGFGEIECFTYDLDLPVSPEAWRDRCGQQLEGQLDDTRLHQFDRDLSALLDQHFAQKTPATEGQTGAQISVPHRVFALRGVKC
ncbi:class I SAM-dependent methyltransferase [Rhodovibrionaceae bacterium A322]